MRIPVLLPKHRQRLRRAVTMHNITDDEQEALYREAMWHDTETGDSTIELKRMLQELEQRGATYVYHGWQLYEV